VESKDTISIAVRMHADPEKLKAGVSAKAIKEYEKLRVLTVERVRILDTLSVLAPADKFRTLLFQLYMRLLHSGLV
jgi:hypothetical protein